MKIIVSNLNIMTTASQLMKLFIRYGEVRSIQVMKSMRPGFLNSCALIEMDSNNAMMAISELNCLNFMSHYIEVEEV